MTITCNGTLIDLTTPKVMGILNITPDSFFDGGKHKQLKDVLVQTEKMITEGATFIDVGGYSSRPGALYVSEDEELQRIVPVIETLTTTFPNILISVDTFRSKIAKESIRAGAVMVNDITAGNMDSEMFSTIATLQVPYIIMHMQGTPQTMQQNPQYDNVTYDVMSFLSKQLFKLRQLHVNDVIVDVGFGFGKTIAHNFTLLKNLALFKSLEVPMLTGVSRKSMLYKVLNTSPQETLNATTVANTIALLHGTTILRVHDVKEAMEAIQIVSELKRAN